MKKNTKKIIRCALQDPLAAAALEAGAHVLVIDKDTVWEYLPNLRLLA